MRPVGLSRVSGENRGLRGIWRLDFAFGRAYFFGVSAMAHTPTNEQVEMARRHVLRGECLVAQQQLLILPAKNRGLFDLAMQGAFHSGHIENFANLGACRSLSLRKDH